MSDTPRTDARQHNMGSVSSPHYVVDADDMRDLERENARLWKEVEALNSVINAVMNIPNMSDADLAELKSRCEQVARADQPEHPSTADDEATRWRHGEKL